MTFLADSKKIYGSYPEDSQRIIQLSKIVSINIEKEILRLASAKDGAKRALEALDKKYVKPHRSLPLLFNDLRETRTARSAQNVPAVAKLVLANLESGSALMKDDKRTLLGDMVNQIFWPLKLLTDEEKQVLELVKNP